MASDTVVSSIRPMPHIEFTSGTCGGKPRLAGTRIRVQDLAVWSDRLGLSPDEIVSHHPHLTLADVHAGLAYYHDHREVIEADMERGRALVEETRRLFPSKIRAATADATDT